MKPYRLLVVALVAAAVALIAIVVTRNLATPDETLTIDASKASKFKAHTLKAASAGGGAPKPSASSGAKN